MPRWQWNKKLYDDLILDEKELTRTRNLDSEANKMADTFKHWLGIIITVVIMLVIIAMIGLSLSGSPDNSCGQGYHWVEDFRGINSGCTPD